MIVSRVIEDSMPLPGASEDSFTTYLRTLGNLITLKRCFVATNFLRPLARVMVQLMSLYVSIAGSLHRLLEAWKTSLSDGEHNSSLHRSNNLEDLHLELASLRDHIKKCFAYSLKVFTPLAKEEQVSPCLADMYLNGF